MFLWIIYFLFCFFVIGFFAYFCATRAIIFARALLSICIAIMLSHYGYKFVPDQGFLNFLAWALICFGVVHFLSMLPRVDISIRFFCTIVISIFTTELVAMFIGVIFNDDTTFKVTIVHEIVNKIICVGVAVYGIIAQGKKFSSESSRHLIVRIFDRFLASLFYTLSLIIISLSIHAYWQISFPVLVVLLVVGFAGTFVADVFLANKLLFGYTPTQEVEIPK